MCQKNLSKNFQSGLRVLQSTETALFKAQIIFCYKLKAESII